MTATATRKMKTRVLHEGRTERVTGLRVEGEAAGHVVRCELLADGATIAPFRADSARECVRWIEAQIRMTREANSWTR